jgi:DNA end-binding protein Ku
MGLMGMLLRYPYEVRDQADYFDDIQDVKITKDMLDLAKHIVHFNPGISIRRNSRIITRPRCKIS